MFPKPKRIVDEELLESLREQPCFFCNRHPPSEVHHIKTRGSGGHDTADNCLPVCRRCHSEIHLSVSKMAWKYPKLKEWLVKMQRFDILRKL